MREDGDPKAALTITVGVVGTLLVIVILLGLQALYYRVENEEIRAKSYGAAPQELARLRNQQAGALNAYRWIDKEKGIVGIPIDEAMKLTLKELAARP